MARATAEQVWRGLFRAADTVPLLTNNPFAGRFTATLSGTATYSVSTVVVDSDSIIMYSGQSFVASNVAQVIKTNSINPGVGFGFTVTPAPMGPEFIVNWRVTRTQ